VVAVVIDGGGIYGVGRTPPEYVEHEAIHHLLAVNGTPVHDHCHPAFISCDPLKPRPNCSS